MTNLFYRIHENEKEKILKDLGCDILFFQKNNKILTTLKYNNIIGYIIDGEIQIIKTDYNGNKTVIEELEENETFGTIISSIYNDDYEVIAKTDTKIIILEYNSIINHNKVSKSYHQLIKNLLEITTEKMKNSNERIQILTQKTIRDKLLEYFDIMSSKNHTKNIYLPFTFTELADYLSVDRSSMSRELSNLKNEGFIEVKGRKITLLHKTQLDKIYHQILK